MLETNVRMSEPCVNGTKVEYRPKIRLHDLPLELLEQISSHLQLASDFRSLSLSCRLFHSFVEAEGWNIFLRSCFSSIEISSRGRDAAHALATLSKNTTIRAILAREIRPIGSVTHLPGRDRVGAWHRNVANHQTMGYQAIVASHEVISPTDLGVRREIVAWGAGADLVLRVTNRGDKFKQSWYSFKDPSHSDGHDDVVSLNILKPWQKSSTSCDSEIDIEVVVGRPRGELSMLGLNPDSQDLTVHEYKTSGDCVLSTDINNSGSPLLAAALGRLRTVIFPLHSQNRQVEPLSEVHGQYGGQVSPRLWSTRFLADDLLALGSGVSTTIVQVYRVRPDGFEKQPIRSFTHGFSSWTRRTSAYPLAPLPDVPDLTSASASAFLSGGFDGRVRLHDLRSPRDVDLMIKDPVDSGSIYSLVTIGREKIIAGGARDSLLKFYDIRMICDDALAHYSLDGNQNGVEVPEMNLPGWNIFARRARSRNLRSEDSPVYSLSRPSAASPMLYAGLEDRVIEINFTSIMDHNPDPMFLGSSSIRRSKAVENPLRFWSSGGTQYMNLTMYERTDNVPTLLEQRHLNTFKDRNRVYSATLASPGYDVRWQSVSSRF